MASCSHRTVIRWWMLCADRMQLMMVMVWLGGDDVEGIDLYLSDWNTFLWKESGENIEPNISSIICGGLQTRHTTNRGVLVDYKTRFTMHYTLLLFANPWTILFVTLLNDGRRVRVALPACNTRNVANYVGNNSIMCYASASSSPALFCSCLHGVYLLTRCCRRARSLVNSHILSERRLCKSNCVNLNRRFQDIFGIIDSASPLSGRWR